MRNLLLGLGALLALTSSPASASSFYRLDLPEMMTETSDVVHVKVLRVSGAWSEDGGMVWTTAELKVVHSFLGEWDAGDVILAREAGGTVGDTTVTAIGFPDFRVGDELVIHLGAWEMRGMRVLGGPQGFYRVARTASGGATLAAGPTQAHPGPTGDVPGPLVGVALSNLATLLGRP